MSDDGYFATPPAREPEPPDDHGDLDYFASADEPDDEPTPSTMHPDINVGSPDEIAPEKRLPPGAEVAYRTHPLSIAALASSLLWGYGVLSFLGFVLGIVARRAIRASDRRWGGVAMARVATTLGLIGALATGAWFGWQALTETQAGLASESAVREVLTDVSDAQLSHLTDEGRYAASFDELAPYLDAATDDGTFRIARADGTGYCAEATVTSTGAVLHISESDSGRPADGPCP